MKKLLIAGALASVLAAPVMAEGSFSGNVTLTSDYVWRGVSQSNEDMAIQGGFDFEHDSGFYVGTWASSIDFESASDPNVELDIYAGFGGALTDALSYDVGVIGYLYPDADAEDLDFTEIYAGLGYDTGTGLGLGGYVYYDPDNQNIYVEGSAGFGLVETEEYALSVDAAVGNYSFDGGGDYTTWNIGSTLSLSGFDLDLRYWDTDIDPSGGITEDRFVLSVSRAM